MKTKSHTEPERAAADPKEPEPSLEGVEDLKAERDKFKDLAYRSAAELENYKRRVGKEREELAASLKERFACQLLPVIDALELAADPNAAGQDAQVPAEFKKYVEGYQAIGRQILGVLERLGVKEIQIPVNAEFQPEQQEAVLTEPVLGLKSPMVLEVLQKGYTLDGRLIRPVRVKVGMPGEPS